MNLECDFLKIECPNCSNVWISKSKAKRVQCSACGKFFKNPNADKSAKVLKSQQIIQDNIMQGNIMDALCRRLFVTLLRSGSCKIVVWTTQDRIRLQDNYCVSSHRAIYVFSYMFGYTTLTFHLISKNLYP